MTGTIFGISYNKVADKNPYISTFSQCFFVTGNIIACAWQGLSCDNMKPPKHFKYCDCFIIIGGYIIPFTSENLYEYPENNISFIVLNKSYDIEISKLSKNLRHNGAAIYNECYNDPVNNMDFKLTWEGKKPNIHAPDPEKLFVVNNGNAGEAINLCFRERKYIGLKESVGSKEIPVIAITLTFEKNFVLEAGSPVFNKKTNEIIGMMVNIGTSADDEKMNRYFAISSFEFIKLMKKQGIIKKKKPWYRF